MPIQKINGQNIDPHSFREFPQDPKAQVQEIAKVAKALLGEKNITVKNDELIYTTRLHLPFTSYSDSCELTLNYSPQVQKRDHDNLVWRGLIERCGLVVLPDTIISLLEEVPEVNPRFLDPYWVFENYFQPVPQLNP